ncbi:aspartate aminotransferase family protein [Chengkuizengella axinellae]|uniref:Aminotransferase class III-fold pyridoxal phosphate-dependent enzyme n=1 Tax=Chengkuizengella axinellae TaxID=3064388 RepID=A0ABT9J048_9BACL|nr:aminotransferase class III-fold pyridoxal phosphate-dependent enzyme [Chengkuizengella sp. 2205SS18-9]MDP5274989.1 aminotransferase class III-fold pyridoxal phosphate-dependent enzyme [Chengkuizengella sp. 2205SS18-9]
MEKRGYAISSWHNTEKIYAGLDHLMKQPIRPVKREEMDNVLDYFNTRCAKSKEMVTEAKNFIPGGVQHNLAFNFPFPIVVNKAEGAYLWDIDGNQYIDFLQSGGPIILGNNYQPVREKVIELIHDCGPVTGLFHEYEYKLAKLINQHMPSIEMYRMLGSGTEAVMAAIRMSRLATGKKKVIKIGGAYHGWSDQMVYGLKIPGTRRFEAHGIPRTSTKHTQEVKPNDISALRRQLKLNKLRGGTACVIVEPIGPESGTRPVYKEYNQQVRKLCDEFDTLLIFDEVVTGFRMGLGGAQGYFDVKPDLTIFGKVIAGGYPSAGGIGGRKDLMSRLAAGLESGKKRAYVGGTLAANPISALAGYYTIKEIEKTNACEAAGRAGDRLTAGLNEIIDKYNLPFVAYNQGSICHLETAAAMFVKLGINIISALGEIKKRKHMMEEMGAAYLAEGIITLAGSRLYTSLADTDEVIDDALERFDRVFQKIEGV